MSNEDRAWSSAPIIALDGGDPPAEVKVVRGYGYVAELKEKDRAINVVFMAHDKKTGQPREFLPAAWVPKTEEKLISILKASHAKERNIFYRIEIRRQDKIDRKIPIEELTPLAKAKDSIFKGLAAIKVKEDDEWIFAKAALTNPLEDPSDERFQSAVGKAPRNFSGQGGSSEAPTHSQNYRGIEPPGYITVLRNGEINPGAFAVAQPLGAYSLATKLIRDGGFGFDKKQRLALAKGILQICSSMQLAIWDGKLESVDIAANSFSRGRYFLEEVIATDEPLTEDLFEDTNFQDWRNRVEAEALKLWKWSINMVAKTVEVPEESEED